MATQRAATQGLGSALNQAHAIHEIAQAYQRVLAIIDPDPDRDGLTDTPMRVARALLEMTQGHATDPAAVLGTTFDVQCDEMIAVRNIAFTSLCEHHVLPFTGTAHVAYVPGASGRVVGLSKIPRLVEAFARRLQVQERLTNQIADALQEHLQPLGAAVLVVAQHHCMSCRGVRQPDARMETTALRGVFKDDARARTEFLAHR